MTKGELKSWLDAFEDFPDYMLVSVNVGFNADNIMIVEGTTGFYLEGWVMHEHPAQSEAGEDDLFGERRGAMGQL